MPSKHLLDPDLAPMLELIPGGGLNRERLVAMRQMMTQMGKANVPPPPAGVTVSERLVPGPAGSPDVRVLVSSPAARGAGRPAVLHIHGGGYVMGSPDSSAANNAALVLAAGAVVVSVDYRLAPETPHPGPVEDCYAALKWLHASAGDLGVDTARIAVSGESAGGGLAANLCLMARDRGEVPVAYQHLIFPMLDDRTASSGEIHEFAGQFIWTREANVYGWESLLGHAPGQATAAPYAVAARAESLAGLPPTFISCGALDLFIEEDIDYARRLIAAGVPTELHIYPGAPHAFQMVAEARVAKAHAEVSLAAMKRGLGA